MALQGRDRRDRLVRISVAQDEALQAISVRSEKPVAKLIREAIEVYTGVPDTVASQRRHGPIAQRCGQ